MSADAYPFELTQMLQAAAGGNIEAGDRLLPLVYDELRRLAQDHMRRTPPGNTFQPTALVHEAYLRLVGQGDPGWQGRQQFFAAAARSMRDILVEQARRKAAIKHGGGRRRVAADEVDLPIQEPVEDVVALDAVLKRLESRDARKGEIVMLRYFAGLTQAETAAAMGLSERTVEREWRYIKAWLRRELANSSEGDPS
jgi:RNA polymerase sigma factor (TIGR02999 family)